MSRHSHQDGSGSDGGGPRMMSRLRSVLVAAIAALAAAFATAPVAHGEVPFEFEPGAQALSQAGPGANLAGAHPDVTLTFRVRQDPVSGLPGQAPNSAAVELPAGMVGDLRALDVCAVDDVIAAEKPAGAGRCPRRAAAGLAQFDVVYPNGGGPPLSDRRLWRVPAGPGEVAAFA
ncbi:MAG: hypothetical protein GXY03_15450, partial [Solirubrobacterales bacterium]|nr:hypothetical protein [Solirubrobacterales bacterium]